jgi:ABC-2 type transport system ATP-binding protein
MQTEKTAIEVENLTKSYGKVQALKSVNLKVEPGTIFGLVGSNGAGKSTLIKILIGSSKPDSGAVRVLGINPFKDPFKLRQQIGYMPQAAALYDDLPARANIAFFGAAHKIPHLNKRVDEVLEFTQLSHRQKDPAYGFSGGMKQRLSLACAIIHQPKLLLLDEPTAGVDPKLREAFWRHFRELAAQGTSLLISTHMMDEAFLCDKLVIMREGEILACDSPKNIMRMGETLVRVRRDSQEDVFRVSNYPEQLPSILQKYSLDPSITRVELEEDNLETIMLRIIDERESVLAGFVDTTTTEKEAHHV